jgi:hypothetical protein
MAWAALTVSVTVWRLRLRTQPEASQTKLENDGAVKQGWKACSSWVKLGTMHGSSMDVSR